MNQRIKIFSKDLYQVELPVEPEHHQMRLDQFIQLYMNSFSRETIKKKILKGDVTISNKHNKLRASTRLHHGQKVTITTKNPQTQNYWRGRPLKDIDQPQIIFQDDNAIVAYKPPFMSTHPTGKHLFNCLTIWLEEQLNASVHNVHRLDLETSGILILGKNPKTTQRLTELFEKRAVKKCYFFLAKKTKQIPNLPFSAYESLAMKKDFKPSMYVHCYPSKSPHAKEAQTDFFCLQQTPHYLAGLAFPITGRQHQIRAHAAHHGFCLLGDKMYGPDASIFSRHKENQLTDYDFDYLEIPRHALHACALKIAYPQQQTKTYYSPLPADLKHWIEQSEQLNLVQITQRMKDIIQNRFSDNPDNTTHSS